MYNTVILIGRLTKDPEIKKTENDKDYSNIILAVQRAFKNSEGIYEADFIKCTLWEPLAKKAKEYCKKGDLVSVKGQLRSSSYEVDGEKKYSIEVVVERLSFLSTTKTNEELSDE